MKEYHVISQKPWMMKAPQHIVMEKKFFKVTQSINQSAGNLALNGEWLDDFASVRLSQGCSFSSLCSPEMVRSHQWRKACEKHKRCIN